jgi:hypothetical protein
LKSNLKIKPETISSENDLEMAKTLTTEVVTYFIVKFLIIFSCMPLNLVESEGFRAFMRLVCPLWEPIRRYGVMKEIEKINNISESRKREILKSVGCCSVTVDLWTDRTGRTFLGVTSHFCVSSAKALNLKSLVLALRVFQVKHTGEQIYEALIDVLKDHGIQDKVTRIITDNGANMVKAIRLVSQKWLDDESKEEDEEDRVVSKEEEDDELDEEIDNYGQDEVQEFDEEFIGLMDKNFANKHMRCFTHSLQLCIKNSLSLIKPYSKLIKKCITIARKSRKVEEFVRLLKKNEHNVIVKPIKIRWNSDVDMLTSIIDIGNDNLTNYLKTCNLKHLVLNDTDFKKVIEITEILQPFADITIMAQAENFVTLSTIIPSYHKLLHHLRQKSANVSKSGKSLVDELQNQLTSRFKGKIFCFYRV